MSNKWAYTAFGATYGRDFWESFSPQKDNYSVPLTSPLTRQNSEPSLLSCTLSKVARTTLPKDEELAMLKQGVNVIGFDGQKWLTGHVKIVGTDYKLRPIDFLHGYTSDTADFPETLPTVNTEHFQALHEKHIVPIWEETDTTQVGEWVQTPFESVPASAISEQLPEEAVQALRNAHAKGEHVALYYNAGEKKKWGKLHEWLEAKIAENERLAQQEARAANAALEDVPAAVKGAEGLAASLRNIPTGGKITIGGAAVALGGLMTYWLFKSKHRESETGARAGRS